ncbi:MAG: hypothetical protein WC718_00330 [Phycisphaerales bacterium]|jgi:hypothetical protein
MAGCSVDTLYDLHQARIAPGDDDEFLRFLTEADMTLLEGARWRWCRNRVSLTPVNGILTLPAGYAAILGARADEWPALDINAEEYEFAPGGPGEMTVGGSHGARLIDQGLDGDGARTYKLIGFSDEATPPTIYTLCMYSPFTLYRTEDLPAAPTADESDRTRCESAKALKLAMQATIYEEKGDNTSAASYMSSAIKVLNSHETNQRGNARQTPIVRSGGAGLSRGPHFL